MYSIIFTVKITMYNKPLTFNTLFSTPFLVQLSIYPIRLIFFCLAIFRTISVYYLHAPNQAFLSLVCEGTKDHLQYTCTVQEGIIIVLVSCRGQA